MSKKVCPHCQFKAVFSVLFKWESTIFFNVKDTSIVDQNVNLVRDLCNLVCKAFHRLEAGELKLKDVQGSLRNARPDEKSCISIGQKNEM